MADQPNSTLLNKPPPLPMADQSNSILLSLPLEVLAKIVSYILGDYKLTIQFKRQYIKRKKTHRTFVSTITGTVAIEDQNAATRTIMPSILNTCRMMRESWPMLVGAGITELEMLNHYSLPPMKKTMTFIVPIDIPQVFASIKKLTIPAYSKYIPRFKFLTMLQTVVIDCGDHVIHHGKSRQGAAALGQQTVPVIQAAISRPFGTVLGDEFVEAVHAHRQWFQCLVNEPEMKCRSMVLAIRLRCLEECIAIVTPGLGLNFFPRGVSFFKDMVLTFEIGSGKILHSTFKGYLHHAIDPLPGPTERKGAWP